MDLVFVKEEEGLEGKGREEEGAWGEGGGKRPVVTIGQTYLLVDPSVTKNERVDRIQDF